MAWVLDCYVSCVSYSKVASNGSRGHTPFIYIEGKTHLWKGLKEKEERIFLLRVLWSIVVSFWRRVSAFEENTAWSRGIPWNFFKWLIPCYFSYMLIYNFHHLNTKEIKIGFIWLGVVSFWRIVLVFEEDTSWNHIWELPGNYPVFSVVMVIYHYVERIWRILVTPILIYNIYDHQ